MRPRTEFARCWAQSGPWRLISSPVRNRSASLAGIRSATKRSGASPAESTRLGSSISLTRPAADRSAADGLDGPVIIEDRREPTAVCTNAGRRTGSKGKRPPPRSPSTASWCRICAKMARGRLPLRRGQAFGQHRITAPGALQASQASSTRMDRLAKWTLPAQSTASEYRFGRTCETGSGSASPVPSTRLLPQASPSEVATSAIPHSIHRPATAS